MSWGMMVGTTAMQQRVFIYDGLGCSRWDEGIPETSRDGRATIIHVCNASVSNTIKHISRVCTRSSDAIKDPSYVRTQTACVQAAVEERTVDEVYVVGHSYGGFIAARICERLDTHRNAAKLRLFTFGSIYMARPMGNITTITQFMNMNDVAIRCNGAQVPSKQTKWTKPYLPGDDMYADEVRRHDNDFTVRVKGRDRHLCNIREWWYDTAHNICWMRPRGGARKRTPWQQANPLNKLEWDVHNDYPPLNKLLSAFHE